MRPKQPHGVPDLRQFTESAAYYFEFYKQRRRDLDKGDVESSWNKRTLGQWGLIAKGAAAVPYAMQMLKSSDPDEREDAGGILGWLGGDDSVVDAVLAAAEVESDRTAKDSLVATLGELGSKRAIPFLRRVLTDDDEDPDTADLAAHSLGGIVHRRFDRGGDVIGAAREWLANHPPDERQM